MTTATLQATPFLGALSAACLVAARARALGKGHLATVTLERFGDMLSVKATDGHVYLLWRTSSCAWDVDEGNFCVGYDARTLEKMLPALRGFEGEMRTDFGYLYAGEVQHGLVPGNACPDHRGIWPKGPRRKSSGFVGFDGNLFAIVIECFERCHPTGGIKTRGEPTTIPLTIELGGALDPILVTSDYVHELSMVIMPCRVEEPGERVERGDAAELGDVTR